MKQKISIVVAVLLGALLLVTALVYGPWGLDRLELAILYLFSFVLFAGATLIQGAIKRPRIAAVVKYCLAAIPFFAYLLPQFFHSVVSELDPIDGSDLAGLLLFLCLLVGLVLEIRYPVEEAYLGKRLPGMIAGLCAVLLCPLVLLFAGFQYECYLDAHSHADYAAVAEYLDYASQTGSVISYQSTEGGGVLRPSELKELLDRSAPQEIERPARQPSEDTAVISIRLYEFCELYLYPKENLMVFYQAASWSNEENNLVFLQMDGSVFESLLHG